MQMDFRPSRRVMNLTLASVRVAITVFAIALPLVHANHLWAEVVMYGINDPIGNGSQPGDVPAKIIQISMGQAGSTYSATFSEVFNTGMYGQANAFAYDTARDHMFFISSTAPGGTFSAKSLYYWDRGATLGLLANATQAGVGASIPANAVYYNNAFWFFKQNATSDLVRVNLNYSGGTPSYASTDIFTIAGYNTSIGYGDIAINALTGTLYGASSSATNTALFFSLDVSGASPTGFNVIKATGNPGVQLAFSPDYTTLFGQNYADGKWYTINVASGDMTDIAVTSPSSMRQRDLGGSSFTAVPEPSTYLLVLSGLAGLGVLHGRRKTPAADIS